MRSELAISELCVVAGEKAQRRGSVGSLDSGMSVSFQSTSASASSCSRSDKLAGKQAGKPGILNHQGPPGPHGFLGGIFNKKASGGQPKSTEV